MGCHNPSQLISVLFSNECLLIQANSPPVTLSSPIVIVPAVVALIGLLVTNAIVLWKIRLDSRSSLKRELTLQEIGRLKERLQNFYDPLLALTKVNQAMFDKLGRNTFPQDQHLRSDALAAWNSVVESVILPTNRKLCAIIKEYSHLIDPRDDLEQYMAFVVHAESYEIFVKQRNEIHKKFLYPENFDVNLQQVRAKVIDDLENAERDIGSYLLKGRH